MNTANATDATDAIDTATQGGYPAADVQATSTDDGPAPGSPAAAEPGGRPAAARWTPSELARGYHRLTRLARTKSFRSAFWQPADGNRWPKFNSARLRVVWFELVLPFCAKHHVPPVAAVHMLFANRPVLPMDGGDTMARRRRVLREHLQRKTTGKARTDPAPPVLDGLLSALRQMGVDA